MAKEPLVEAGSKLNIIDTFVLAGVVTILAIRGYLMLTGYPQIGNETLHIAHVLWGGLLMTVALFILLLKDKPNKLLAALLGGIGFGFFIDEIGKFITQDNDYFYKPSVALIYIAFLLIWFLCRLLIVRSEKTPFLSPAEWPRRHSSRVLIIMWAIAQLMLGFALALAILFFGLDSLSKAVEIARLGVIIGFIYACWLGVGLYRYSEGKLLAAAHELRAATLFGIVALYPFLYFEYPFEATIGIILTIIVAIGLSEISFVRLIKKLLLKSS